ncbi:TniQ family protein [Streptomyces sp. NBC_01563]
MITPLPRSLDPLAGELLAGYVMRLAHRLDVAPDTVLRRTGLVDIQANTQAVTRTALSLELPAQRMNDFRTATRLTEAEAAALTLLPLAPHYPPIVLSLNVARTGKRIPARTGLALPRRRPLLPRLPRRRRNRTADGPWRPMENRLETARRLRVLTPPALPRTCLP